MPRDSIPPKRVPLLWGKAAGCCEICAKPVYEEWHRKQTGNYSNIAHIAAASPGGPRYDATQTPEERESLDNLMLLCRSCHTLIDENVDDFPTEMLHEMKAQREMMVASLMQGLKPELCTVVKYLVPFGDSEFSLSDIEWKRALLSRGIGYEGLRPYDLNSSSGTARDAANIPLLASALEEEVAAFKKIGYNVGPIAVFALAPQPLLIKLGALLGDETELIIFQRSRSHGRWCGTPNKEAPRFKLATPPVIRNATEAALLLSASGKIHRNSLPSGAFSPDTPIYEMELSNAGVDAADAPHAPDEFKSFITNVLYQIHEQHPHVRSLHVFPAMPVSFNVAFGAALNANVIPTFYLYEKRNGVFARSLTIGASK